MKQLLLLVLMVLNQYVFGQSGEGNTNNLPVKEYTLIINEEIVKMAGKDVMGMTINGSIPGPILEFTEGEYAIIHVKNNMKVETSIHWHGIILPNFYDGVPYLTTPPIQPGATFKYEFPIHQSGTYWYHSHTMLQEQKGVFGSIVIHPKKETLEFDKELVLMLSDWTNEKPMNVLKTLKRGSEWYDIKKGTAMPLNKVIAKGAFGAQLNFWRQRMEGTDIADIYYPAFLINGKQTIQYPDFKPGEKVRLRIIDAAASTSFWMTFGGDVPLLVSADGRDIVPVKKNKTFIAIAETFDFIVTIPENRKIEFKITAQDGSGTASAFIGEGAILAAQNIPKPDNIAMMQQMSTMDMKMGAHALKYHPNKDTKESRNQMKEEYGMQTSELTMHEMKTKEEDKLGGDAPMKMSKGFKISAMNKGDMKMDSLKISNDVEMQAMKTWNQIPMNKSGMEMKMVSPYNYDYLKSLKKTTYNKNLPVKEILLNLTGNMQRYIWSMNGVPLSETDTIKIKSGEVTRIKLNNLTMMHHPMHLHGHFFRVLNKNGDYSPLKHTVNVPPMQQITIEFYGDAYGDWFFHCHILYHLMGGMARVFSYGTPPDTRMKEFPAFKIIAETNRYYSWGMASIASHMSEFNFMTSNFRNQFAINAEYGWNENIEVEATYERYLHDYLSIFVGMNIENEIEDTLHKKVTTAISGIRFLTPYLFDLDVRIDSKLRPQISLEREILVFPRTFIFGAYEYQADFGWVSDFSSGDHFNKDVTWNIGVKYQLSKNFLLAGSYDTRFGAGGGLSVRF